MDARFSLANHPSAPASAAQIVHTLLSAWGCEDEAARAEAGDVVADAARRIQDGPATRLMVGLRHYRNDVLSITVGAYEGRGMRPDREERSSVAVVLPDSTNDAVQAATPRRPARAKAAAHTPAPAHPPAAPAPATPASAAPAPAPAVVASGSDVTLADLAQRFEESPWFVRRRVAAGTLPPPDGEDAAGEPVWHARTLSEWRDEIPTTPPSDNGTSRSQK